jgi:hypothetical protein
VGGYPASSSARATDVPLPGRDGLTLFNAFPPAAGVIDDAPGTEPASIRAGEVSGPGASTAKPDGVALVRVAASATARESARAAPDPAVLRNGAAALEVDGAENA